MKTILSIIKKYKFRLVFVGLLSMIVMLFELILPYLNKELLDRGLIEGNFKSVIYIAFAMVIATILQYLIKYISQRAMIKVQKEASIKVKRETIENVLSKKQCFFDDYDTEYLINRINESDNIVSIISDDLFVLIASILAMIIAMFILIRIDIIFFIIGIITIIMYIISIVFPLIKISKTNDQLLDQDAEYNKKLYSTVNGIIELKQYNQTSEFSNSLYEDIVKLNTLGASNSNLINLNINIVQGSMDVIKVAVSIIVAIYVINGKLTIGQFFLVTQYIALLSTPIIFLQSFLMTNVMPFISSLRVEDLRDDSNEHSYSNGLDITKIDKIEFKDVSFRYKDIDVINHLSFIINKNSLTKLTGRNGSGKSTIIKLILGLYSSYDGEILINGYDLKKYDLNKYRSKIGVLPQNVFLFDGSIEDNIKIGNDKLTEKEFKLRLNDFKNQGLLDTLDISKNIIDNGKNLSGGQIKMIALCRLLLKSPDLIILDEATTHMDVQLKDRFLNIIKELMNDFGKSILFVTHEGGEFSEYNTIKL